MVDRFFKLGFLHGLILAGLLLPTFAFAYTHTFTCSDAHFTSSASCSSDSFTIAANGYYGFDSFLPSPSGTWYMSATWDGGSPSAMCAQAAGTITTFLNSGTYSNEAVVFYGDTSMILDNRDTAGSGCIGNSHDTTYTISNLCISDDPTGCGGSTPTTTPTYATSSPAIGGFIEQYGTPMTWIAGSFLFVAIILGGFDILLALREHGRKQL